VIVDEAQSLSLDVLEQLYMLSSLEIDGRKLLGIILIGEPWLIDLAARTASAPPAQSTSYHLPPFTENETCAYVRHRMAIAGSARDVFDVDALRDVHRQKYVEGEKLENGAVLERIEPDGIVVVQEGRRLRLRSETW
jgi:general secretion pathway protein A